MADVTVINAKKKYEGAIHAAIYCRVSSTKKDQIKSLQAQISGLTNLIAYMPKYILFDSYVDIASGSTIEGRPELQRLIHDCKTGKIKFVLTKSISRFSRDAKSALNVIREISLAGGRIHFEEEKLDSDDPDLSVYVAAYLSAAEMENRDRSANILWGLKSRSEAGISKSYNKVCYGYCHDDEGKLCIKESEAENVRFIYNCYLDGYSVVGIIKQLKAKKILSPTGKESWNKRSIENILSNKKYTGTAILTVEGNQYVKPDNHPAIISSEAFEAVQVQRSLRSNISTDQDGVSTRKSIKYSGIRTVRETYDPEKDLVKVQNMLEQMKLDEINARLGRPLLPLDEKD